MAFVQFGLQCFSPAAGEGARLSLRNHVCITFEHPHDLPDIVLETKAIAGWREADCKVSRLAGDAWLLGAKTALLLVPSVVFDVCLNASINPAHAGSARIRVASVDPIRWAETLFSPGT